MYACSRRCAVVKCAMEHSSNLIENLSVINAKLVLNVDENVLRFVDAHKNDFTEDFVEKLET